MGSLRVAVGVEDACGVGNAAIGVEEGVRLPSIRGCDSGYSRKYHADDAL
jgi:hypothetical protein